MKRLLAVGLLLAVAAGAAWAEKFEDKQLGIALTAPEGFAAGPNAGKKDDFIGEQKAIFASPDVQNNAAILLIHHMDLPGGMDYATLKGGLADLLKNVFAAGFKVVKQEELKTEGLTGFMLDFECPGDGTKPAPGGNVPHHVRWYLVQDGDKKLVGLLYAAREAAWKDVEPKFTASANSLKHAGN
jgi:hypothetical protein